MDFDPRRARRQQLAVAEGMTQRQRAHSATARQHHLSSCTEAGSHSGFNERAWGARSVRLGADLPRDEWAAAVHEAIDHFDTTPWILQRYEKPRTVQHHWFDFDRNELIPMTGRARLCPYYFVQGENEVKLGGMLATICPADKKIIHGMKDAILAPRGNAERD